MSDIDIGLPRNRLYQGLMQLNLNADLEKLCEQLIIYLTLLQKWNHKHNLTAIRDEKSIITHHFLDSLSLHRYCQGDYFVDVGAGAGFPSLPLALIFPQKQFMLVDSLQKRIQFLTQVGATLGLKNIYPIHSRIEDYHPKQPIDCIMSRAYASLDKWVMAVQHLCNEETLLLAMKGQYPAEELTKLPSFVQTLAVEPLQVPFLNEARHVVLLRILNLNSTVAS